MAHLQFHTQTELSPEEVVASLIDFSERRTEIWPYIDPKYYEVISVEENSALVREGTTMGPMKVWAIEKYTWGPNRVRLTVTDSNFCTKGNYVEFIAHPREGGGSNVTVEWERKATSMSGRMAVVMIKGTGGKPLKDSLTKGFANYKRMTS